MSQFVKLSEEDKAELARLRDLANTPPWEPPAPRSDAEMIAGYAYEAAGRAKSWVWFHHERGEARSRPPADLESFEDLADAIETLQQVVDDGADRPTRDLAVAAMSDAFDAAQRAAENGCQAYTGVAWHQLLEVEGSPMRGCIRAVQAILEFADLAADGWMAGAEARAEAAERLAVTGYPPEFVQ